MGTPRLLTDSQAVEIALGVLCGFPVEDFTESYGVGPDMIKASILGKRSKEWGNPLVEFYRETPSRQRVRNGVHTYLADNNREVPNAELVEGLPGVIYDKIQGLYEPAVAELTHDTNLPFFMQPRTPHEVLIANLYGEPNPLHYAKTKLLDRLEEAYGSEEIMRLSVVLAETKTDILTVIKDGGFTMSPEKIHLIEEALETASQTKVRGRDYNYLSPREREVVELRFGLTGEAPMSLQEVATKYEVQRERIRQTEAQALRKLRHPKFSKILRFLATPRTPQETHDYLADMAYQKERAYWQGELEPGIRERVLAEVVSIPGKLEELQELRERDVVERYGEIAKTPIADLELSVRTANCLQNANITNIGGILEKTTSDMLKTKNFGRKSLNEIKEILQIDYGITWPAK